MFDLGWPELMLIMLVALIVIGPKELPNAIRTVTDVVRKLRSAAREFQSGLDDIARESGMDEVKRDLDGITHYDPGEALEAIAESDKDLLDLQDDPDVGNSILDPSAKPPENEAGNQTEKSDDDDVQAATGDAASDTSDAESDAPSDGETSPKPAANTGAAS